MVELPFVLRASQLSSATEEAPGRDELTSEDPLPAALEIDAAGYILGFDTKLTEVRRETTDDT